MFHRQAANIGDRFNFYIEQSHLSVSNKMSRKTLSFLIVTGLLVCSSLPVLAQESEAAKPLVVENAVLKIVEQRDIPARTSGIIEESFIREGSLVAADQLVMKIDNAETLQ